VTLVAYERYVTVLSPGLWDVYRRSIVATLQDVSPAAQIVADDGSRIVGTVLLFPAGAVMASPGPRR